MKRLICVAVLLGCQAADDAPDDDDDDDATPPTLSVTNLSSGTTLGYNLPLVRGQAPGTTVEIESNGEVVTWPVVGGFYKALVPLAPGDNAIALRAGDAQLTLALAFAPQTNDHLVRPLWVEASDGDGSFDAPPGTANTAADGAARVQIAAWMWQSFYAEVMAAQGRGRTTFALALDAQHRPVVTTVRARRTLAELRAMADVAIWSQLYSDLISDGGAQRDAIKDVAILSFSHYVPDTGELQGGGALGGAHQAMMQGSSVWTWPATLADVAPQLTATALVDTDRLSDDSAGRGTVWANAATTSGALLHELGHTLGFDHDVHDGSVMARGFDTWTRYFMISEPTSLGSRGLAPIADDDLPAGFVDYQAAWLASSPWFTQTPPPPLAGPISATTVGDDMTIESQAPIRVAIFADGGVSLGGDSFADARTKVTYSLAALHARFRNTVQLYVHVEDASGQTANLYVP